jgi:hypothetical protein
MRQLMIQVDKAVTPLSLFIYGFGLNESTPVMLLSAQFISFKFASQKQHFGTLGLS